MNAQAANEPVHEPIDLELVDAEPNQDSQGGRRGGKDGVISINPYKPLPKIGAPVTAFSPRGRAELYTSDSSMEATDSNELAAADTADDDISSTVIEQISLSPPPSPPHLSDWSGPTVRVSLKRLAGNIRERATKQYELREMRRMLKRLQQAEAAGVELRVAERAGV